MKFKNMLKTVVSTAIVMSIGTTTLPLSVSAELSESAEPYASTKYYNSCDIDRNGKVEIMDSVLFNRCMVGADYISDYKQLDADTNGIVNWADAKCILCNLVSNSYMCEVDGLFGGYTNQTISGTYPINAPTSAKYVKYDYATMKTSTYTLSLPKAYTPSTASMYSNNTPGIIGDDDREYLTNQSEFTGIVNIQLRKQGTPGVYSSWSSRSTGFIVGDHQIATAAHCVYGNYTLQAGNHFYGKPGTNLIFLYDKDGNRTGITVTPVEAHIPQGYIDYVNSDDKEYTEYDYALITVEEDLSEYTHFDLGLTTNPYDSVDFSMANIYVSGIPGVFGPNNSTNYRIAKGVGNIYTDVPLKQDTILYYDTDTTSGNSGGPAYVVTQYEYNGESYTNYAAIGIVSGAATDSSFNLGIRVIPLIQKFYQNNPNYSY